MGFIKRRYSDFRFGLPLVLPIFSFGNFAILAYNFTALKNFLGFEIFTVLLASFLVVTISLVGKLFRKIQLSTDHDLVYEQQRQFAKTQRIILECLQPNALFSDQHMIEERIQYLKKIESK